MFKLKNVAGAAACGFALSFFISIAATHKFGSSIARGIVFGFLFGILAFVIDLVYGKFLSDDSDNSVDSLKSDSSSGAKVDITIGDADLTNDGAPLAFSVSRNRFSLPDEDTSDLHKNDIKMDVPTVSASPVGSVTPESSGGSGPTKPVPVSKAAEEPVASASTETFQPVTLGRPVEEAAPAAKTPSAPSKPLSAAAAAKRSEREADKKEIDALPDLDTFGEMSNEGIEADDTVIEDTEFATDGGMSDSGRRVTLADGSKASNHDTETLAKAIRTVLHRDE